MRNQAVWRARVRRSEACTWGMPYSPISIWAFHSESHMRHFSLRVSGSSLINFVHQSTCVFFISPSQLQGEIRDLIDSSFWQILQTPLSEVSSPVLSRRDSGVGLEGRPPALFCFLSVFFTHLSHGPGTFDPASARMFTSRSPAWPVETRNHAHSRARISRSETSGPASSFSATVNSIVGSTFHSFMQYSHTFWISPGFISSPSGVSGRTDDCQHLMCTYFSSLSVQ